MADLTVLAIQTFVVVPSVFDDSPLLQSAIGSKQCGTHQCETLTRKKIHSAIGG